MIEAKLKFKGHDLKIGDKVYMGNDFGLCKVVSSGSNFFKVRPYRWYDKLYDKVSNFLGRIFYAK